MRTRMAAALAAGAALWSGCAVEDSTGSADRAAELITSESLLADVQALSADEMEGRGAGTQGEQKAAEYIRERFVEIGLDPVEGSYFQAVKLVGMKKDPEKSSLTITGKEGQPIEYTSDETLTYWSTAQKEQVKLEDAPLVFAGYGVEAPEEDWDDFKGADVAGKVLLFLNNDPPVTEEGRELFGGEARTYYGRWTYKFEQAMRKGAAGAFMIHTTPSASYGFNVVQHSGSEEHFALDLPNSGYQVDLLGWIDEPTSQRIAQAMGTDLEGLFEMGASRDFQPVDTGFRVSAEIASEIRRLETRNVMGMLEGRDPELKDETIVFSAHYDHLGTNEGVEGDDKIFNGAWDNASGTACVINLAKAFAALEPRPRRSLLFLACAAEESGSLGSRWFVTNPPFERSRLVGNFNIDMTQIFGITTDISAIGLGTNTLGDVLKDVAGKYGVTVVGDTDPNAGSFYRSDQVNFAKAGIPALFINPGENFQEPLDFDPQKYFEEHYHRVEDEIDDNWNLEGAARDMRIVFEAALEAANADPMPRWEPGNEFEEEWKALHGKE